MNHQQIHQDILVAKNELTTLSRKLRLAVDYQRSLQLEVQNAQQHLIELQKLVTPITKIPSNAKTTPIPQKDKNEITDLIKDLSQDELKKLIGLFENRFQTNGTNNG